MHPIPLRSLPPVAYPLTSGVSPAAPCHRECNLQASSGVISGMTTLIGSFPFTTKVTDSYGQSATQALDLVVSSSSATGTCAGVYPSLRCDLSPQAYPTVIPCPGPVCSGGGALVGAGYTLTPPDFPTTPVCRLTDNSLFPTDGWTTSNDTSSEVNDFSLLKDFITLGKSGNVQYLFALNASACTATLASAFTPPGTGSTGTGKSGASWFSYTQPHILYHGHPCLISTEGAGCVANNDLSINQYDVTSCEGAGITTCNPTPSVTVDVASACGVPALNGSVNSGTEWSEGISVDGSSQWYFGPASTTADQGSPGDVWAIAWYSPTDSCYAWNTSTGVWSLNGTAQGTVTTSARLSLHNLRGTKGNGWVRLVPEGGTCAGTDCTANGGISELFWQPTTGTVVVNAVDLGGGNQGGHAAEGYNLWVSKINGSVDVNGLFTHTMAIANPYSSLPAAYPSPEQPNGAHISWANDNTSDTAPYAALFEIDSSTFPVTYPWDNELLLVATDGSGIVWRAAHTYSSASEFVPGSIAQDGSLLAWTTSWNGMVGCTDGITNLCINGAPFDPDSYYSLQGIFRPTPAQGNAGGYLFQVTRAGKATTVSSWNQTVGGTTSSGGAIFTNIGFPNGSDRTDVFLAILLK